MAAIDGRHIGLTYSDGTQAVNDVTLTVPEEEFFGFLGPNGAGKTTTIKTLVTLLRPTAGDITVNGYDVETESQAVRKSIGYMAQATSVDEELTARENIQFACEAYGVQKATRRNRIAELLDLVDLADVSEKVAKEFSGGMKKRLDVATALVHDPPLVFLDEPTTGLDPKARIRLWEYFREINDRGTTIFLTTQYLEEADELCDRLSVIQDGEIVATDSPDHLKSQVGGDVLEITLEDPTDGTKAHARRIAREVGLFEETTIELTDEGISVTSERARQAGTGLLVALRDANITVTGFDVRSPTLDDVFLAITGEPASDEPESTDTTEPAETDNTETESGDGDPQNDRETSLLENTARDTKAAASTDGTVGRDDPQTASDGEDQSVEIRTDSTSQSLGTRTVTPQCAPPGGELTVRIDLDGITGKLLLVESAEADATIDTISPEPYATTTVEETIYVAWDVAEPTDLSLTYTVSIPESATDGTEISFEGTVKRASGDKPLGGQMSVEIVEAFFERLLLQETISRPELERAGQWVMQGEITQQQFERIYRQWLQEEETAERKVTETETGDNRTDTEGFK